MHAKPDLRVFLKWMIARSGSVITAVIPLNTQMKFTIRTLLFVMLLVGVGVTLYHNSEYYKRWERVEEAIATFDPHQTSHELADYYRQLFTLADDDLLPWMLRHENDSVAIQSAWETVELSVPVEDGKGTYAPSASAITQFLDLIESRRELEIPAWWRQAIEQAKANRRYNIYGGKPTVEPYHNSGLEYIRCPSEARLEKLNDDYVYVAGGMRLTIPNDIMDDHVCAIRDKNRAFAALHDGWGYPHKVACFERDSNEIIWESTACGSWWGGASGFSIANLSLVVAGDSVYVFGVAGGFYVHGSDLKSGQTTFQFSNNF